MKLFHGWLSSASRRCVCSSKESLPYESVAIDMGKQEQHSAAYLAMNPNGSCRPC
jgi:glutathione S-transferase